MPYISQDKRDALHIRIPETAGELNYLLTQTVLDYIGRDYKYEQLNSALGALEACKHELYRRIVVPYEEDAKERNGDAYWRAFV